MATTKQLSKHTPGPWETAPGYYGEGATANIIKSPGGKVAHLDVVMWANGDNEDVLRMKANARLIAAAPDMLVATRKMLALIENAEWTQAERLACIHGAKAAITKAEQA